jgi:polysaccharide chain length determinant protein (PEP-CTERM system associated)
VLEVIEKVQSEVRGVWRHRWLAMKVAWAACAVGWLLVYATPEQYEAAARVYVDTRTSLRPLLQGVAADQDIESQLIMVRQALLGEPNMRRVATEAGLLDASGDVQSNKAAISAIASRITIELEPSLSRDPRLTNTFYRIGYRDSGREKAIKVVELVLNAFVKDTLGTKRESAETAETFLEGQLSQYRMRLTEAENMLAEFKRKNIGMVPGAEGGYFQRLDQEEVNVQRVAAALRVAMSRRAELGRQLRGESAFVPSSQALPASGGGMQAPADTTSRIQETQAELDGLLLRFTEKHPDVIAARETLEELKARQINELEAVRRGDPGVTAIAGVTTNPVHQNIQLQLHQTDVEIAALRGELGDYQANVASLRHALNTAPEVEAEYTRLTRDYEVTQFQYNALLQRFEQARVSEDAQLTGIVDFQVVDPPTAPFRPVFPTRPVLLLAVLFLAVALGVGVAWLLHVVNPVFDNGRKLEEVTGLPVIGVVSLNWLDRYHAELRKEYLRYAAVMGLLLLVTAAVVLAHGTGARVLQQALGQA